MFGYVKINKDEMKFKDFYAYKGVYCSLCRELGENYGLIARITLNYDFTFLALLLLAIDKEETRFQDTRCPFNPLVKCKKCDSKKNLNFNFAAAVAMVTLYYKLIDNISDEKFFKRAFSKFLLIFFKKRYKKATKLHPKLDGIFKKMSREQSQVEAEKASIDRCAHPSATALGSVCALAGKNEQETEVLSRLGYCLGRYVYFMDAYDDYEKDKKNGSFNPFIVNNNFQIASNVINQSAGEAVSAFYLLTPNRYGDILQNILEKGLTNNFRVLQEKHKIGGDVLDTI